MKLTFKQLEDLIASKKAKTIYLSSSSLWFTHDLKDVKIATKKGKKAQRLQLKKHLNDPLVPDKDKKIIKELVKKSKNDIIHLDTEGNPLIINSKPIEWIENVKKNPKHFGKYGLDAFMLTHSKNSLNNIFNNWGEVERYLNKKD